MSTVDDPTYVPPLAVDEMPADPAPALRRSRAARLLRGNLDDPRWVRPSLLALLLGTALLYLWDLGSSGWANAFYSAAAQAGSESWKAFLFGSSDAANLITVDKPPAALWPMAISVRLFGLTAQLSRTPGAIKSPPPKLGEHTVELLAGLGYSKEDVAALREKGIV